MERRVPIEWRLAALAVAAVFLLTSCPAPMVGSRSTPVPAAPVTDRGKIKCCYIDENGKATDQSDAGRVYWVEKEGQPQPARISVVNTSSTTMVVNFIDLELGSKFRLFFVDGANLPYRMVMTYQDHSGGQRSLVGSEMNYDYGSQTFSLRFIDAEDSAQSAVLKNVGLSKDLFKLQNVPHVSGYSIPVSLDSMQYAMAITCYLLYAIGQSGWNWVEGKADFATASPVARWISWGSIKRFFSGAAVISAVAALTLPVIGVITGVAVATAVKACAVVALVSTVAAAIIDVVAPKEYTNASGHYPAKPGGGEIRPPVVAVWQVDKMGQPVANLGEGNWFPNDGVVHLYLDKNSGDDTVYFCVQRLDGTPARGLMYRQSAMFTKFYAANIFTDFNTKQNIFPEDTTKKLVNPPDLFYFSITKTPGATKTSINISPGEIYFVLELVPEHSESSDPATVFNGREGLATRLENPHTLKLEGEKTYRDLFKVNVCSSSDDCQGQ